ncbi:MAG: polysaccharide deacetylase family protein [Chitinophagaceae bacterium]|nr:polysaccharide deacetylase family protein [Chitinophagaceae bacterium]
MEYFETGNGQHYLHISNHLSPHLFIPTFMDPDSADACHLYRQTEQAASQILKTTFMTVVFTTCQHFKNETSFSAVSVNFQKPVTTVTKPVVPDAPKKKKKTIYLTFDDGPNKGTQNLVHIVKGEEIPVTLFIVGEHVYGSKAQHEIFDSLVNCIYVEIANHSFTHAFKNKYLTFYQVPDSVLNDFKRCADSLQLSSRIVRTPGRNIWRTKNVNSTDLKTSACAADSLFANNFNVVGWDLEWHYNSNLELKNTSDDMLMQVDSMFVHAKTKTLDHLVLLAHDQVYADAGDSTELRQFIIKLKAKNEYNFETVSNYPGLKN